MNKMGMTLCLSLAAFLPCGVMQAADIDPIAQHQEKERAQVRETMDRYTAEEKAHRREDARALGRELLLAGEGLGETVKREIGELAVEDAQARVIANIPINQARTALSTSAGDYEAIFRSLEGCLSLEIRRRPLPKRMRRHRWREGMSFCTIRESMIRTSLHHTGRSQIAGSAGLPLR